MSAKAAVPRSRHYVPRPVVWLLWPIYRRSESRSTWGTGSVYILRAVGSRRGPVLRAAPRRSREEALPPAAAERGVRDPPKGRL